jgi:uncharacterized membrane protein YfcA
MRAPSWATTHFQPGIRKPVETSSLIALACVGIAAGWVNTLAGGGSMLTLPALLALGLPADAANATSRIAIVAQGVSGVAGYQRAGKLANLPLGPILVPTMLGGLAGAYVATLIPNTLFRPLLLGTMLAMALALLLKPDVLAPEAGDGARNPNAHRLAWLSLLAAGFYGGLLQAGVGLLLLAVFGGMLRYDLVRGNALKVCVVLAFNLVAVSIFLWSGLVRWEPGLALAAGNAVGAQLGVRFAVTKGHAAIRRVVVVAVVVTCVTLLFR